MIDKKRLLIVDDEPNIRRILEVAFEKLGLQAISVEDAQAAIEAVKLTSFDCVLTDVTMPGMSGFELQKQLHHDHPNLPVILMTAFGTIPQAVQAIRNGAFEFVTKPFDLDNLKKIVQAAIEQPGGKPARAKKGSRVPERDFIAVADTMVDLKQTLEQVADSRATVLLTGESGTGKEVAARYIHDLSPRNGKPFIALSCAALPESLLESELFGYEKGAFTGASGSKAGRFEMAHGGTLFLDEIGEVPMSIQAKLLRVLQEREFERLGATKSTRVDVRLIAATNRDLQEMVDAGTFRLDLLYRLQVIEAHLPPLRERREDILPLAYHFLRLYAGENSRAVAELRPEVAHALESYSWPGNIRELGNVIERAVVMTGPKDKALELKHLPRQLQVRAA